MNFLIKQRKFLGMARYHSISSRHSTEKRQRYRQGAFYGQFVHDSKITEKLFAGLQVDQPREIGRYQFHYI